METTPRLNDLDVLDRIKESHNLNSKEAALKFEQTFDGERPLTANDAEAPVSKVELMEKLSGLGLSPDSRIFRTLWDKHSQGLPLQKR